MIGIFFEPATAIAVTNGELTFGGVDESKFTSKIAYVCVSGLCLRLMSKLMARFLGP